MIGGAQIAIIKKRDGDLGFQAVYSYVAMVIFTPISGILLDKYTGPNNQVNFAYVTYVHFLFCFCLRNLGNYFHKKYTPELKVGITKFI